MTLLKSRGMQIDNKVAALDYLARIGYYRLSGYWYPLREIDNLASQRQQRPTRSNQFIPGSNFKDVVDLYVFDKKLRLLALDALERIEMAVRVDVAHLLGKKAPCAHEEPDLLHGNFAKKVKDNGKTAHQVWLEKYGSLLHRAQREPFIAHHKAKYGGRVPIWVAIEVWDFGLLSRLFDGLKYEDKNHIANKYRLAEGKTLAQWLRSLNFIRNVSAHHSRLWNINILEASPRPQTWPEMNEKRAFMYFSIMDYLLAVICPNSTWTQRLVDLLRNSSLYQSETLALEDFGIIEGWEEWLLRKQK